MEEIAILVFDRLIELLNAPLLNEDMAWVTLPLVLSLLFMTLYFAKHKKEELGWNTAFGNTMIFIFVAIAIIREMYYRSGSWEALLSSGFYTSLIIGLIVLGAIFMYLTFRHLLPKKVAFFLFSTPPMNSIVYVIMAMVYSDVPPDEITALAGVVMLIMIVLIVKVLKIIWGGKAKKAILSKESSSKDHIAIPQNKKDV